MSITAFMELPEGYVWHCVRILDNVYYLGISPDKEPVKVIYNKETKKFEASTIKFRPVIGQTT